MNNTINYLLQDWRINQDTSFKSRLVLLMFRLNGAFIHLPIFCKFFSRIYCIIYQIIVEYILGIELPWNTKIGSNFKLQHGYGLVVNHETVIGTNCTLRHSTTIGNKKLPDGSISASPQIGNNVDIGSNVVIIGPIKLGDNAVIGAGSVVVKDVPQSAVVAGNPAKIIRMINSTSTDLYIRNLENASELPTTLN
ncbi:serine O-acetyltransferase [Dendronalium sp. ChiSLP03b]|uniref:serine O-acetyltransferase n=1 Tax=Dendronalium sp. ChiSLP03b TaxID=3075381 RepID=UPI002AD5ABC9|nr:DapH/DapD/GlmU-related protein [Dendronalium sp. ChiSLP03b]MDZ8206516.1 DapH/DapD/GlmU-related protein [Dendronalium sp. ChiSLP03b]